MTMPLPGGLLMTVAESLGAVYDPLGAHLQDPYPLYARARQEEPVFYSPRLRAQVVTRYADVRAIVRDPASFSSANAIRGITPPATEAIAELQQGAYLPATPVIGADAEAHRWIREPFARHFSPSRIKAGIPFMRTQADALIDTFIGDGQAELVAQFTRPLPLAVITRLFGLDDADRTVVDAGTRGLLLEGTPAPVATQAQAARDLGALHQLLARHVSDRRARPREDDLVSAGLARTELTIALELLTRRLPGLQLAADQEISVDPVFVSRGPTALQVRW